MKTSRCFKNLEGKSEKESLKMTISTSRLLQTILEPDTERCASKDTGSKGVDCEILPTRYILKTLKGK